MRGVLVQGVAENELKDRGWKNCTRNFVTVCMYVYIYVCMYTLSTCGSSTAAFDIYFVVGKFEPRSQYRLFGLRFFVDFLSFTTLVSTCRHSSRLRQFGFAFFTLYRSLSSNYSYLLTASLSKITQPTIMYHLLSLHCVSVYQVWFLQQAAYSTLNSVSRLASITKALPVVSRNLICRRVREIAKRDY
jgi:hypothetical protein